MQLFDTFVGLIINYACPIWGFTKSKELEQIHLKYCKWILGVKSRTGNAAVYGELGRYPLYISRHVQIMKYWLKLLDTDNVILQTVYEDAKNRLHEGFNPFPNKPWFLRVCNTSLLKTLREKEKLLVTSNFFFSHSVFYPFGNISAILIKVKIVVCKFFQFGRV